MVARYAKTGIVVVVAVLAASAAYPQDQAPNTGGNAAVGVAPPVATPAPLTAPPPAAVPATTPAPSATPVQPARPAAAGIEPPPGYLIGADDILNVVFWREKEMSADVVVRPDGRITLPLISDVQASGLTPEQLRARIHEEASKYIEDPSVTVVVKQINSRRVFVTGMVGKPGAYPLSNPTTVLQLLSMAGGVSEFADHKKIIVLRNENGTQKAMKFNYRDVTRGKNLQQNVLLQPGDTVVVP
jgi:polysaccharide export outer membrane protein